MSWRYYESAPRKRFAGTAAVVSEPIATFAAQPHYGEFIAFEPEQDAYWATDLHLSTLDVTPQFFPPAAPTATPYDETGLAWFVISGINVSEVGARAPPGYVDEVGRRVFLTSPEAVAAITDAELQAAGQTHEHPQHEVEEPDYNPFQDGALEAFIAGPPAAVEPDSTFAAQPHYGDIQIDPEDHVDTPLLEGIESFLFPPDPLDVTIATQPHYGELPIPLEETEDYADDSTLDVSWSVDFASGDETTIGTQPLAEQPWFAEQDTEDYANDTALDVTAQFFPPPATDDSYIATIDVLLHPFHEEEEPLNASDADQLEAYLSPNDAFDVTIATQYPLAEQPWFADQEIDTELANDTTLDDLPVFAPPDVSGEFFATQPLAEQPWYPEQETEDYQNEAALDVAWSVDFASGDELAIATQPLAEFPEFPPDDPTNDQPLVDGAVEATLFPPTFAPDAEALAATQIFEQDIANTFPDPDPTNDQPLVDGAFEAVTAGPDIDPVLAVWASQTHDQTFGEEEWQPDAQADQSEFLALATDDGYIATLDIFTDPSIEVEEAWIYQVDDDDAVSSVLAGDDGIFAAIALAEHNFDPDPEQPEQPLIDEGWIGGLPITVEIVAATQHLPVEIDAHFIPEPEIDPNLPSLEVIAQLFPPAPPSGVGPDFIRATLSDRWSAQASLRWQAHLIEEPLRWSARLMARWRTRSEGRW